MSIHRKGLRSQVIVICTQDLKASDYSFKKGERLEVALDLGTMWILKSPQGLDLVAPKEFFVLDTDSSEKKT